MDPYEELFQGMRSSLERKYPWLQSGGSIRGRSADDFAAAAILEMLGKGIEPSDRLAATIADRRILDELRRDKTEAQIFSRLAQAAKTYQPT